MNLNREPLATGIGITVNGSRVKLLAGLLKNYMQKPR